MGCGHVVGSPAETSLRHSKVSLCLLCSLMKKERVSHLVEVRETYLGRPPGAWRPTRESPHLSTCYKAFCQLKRFLAFSFCTFSSGSPPVPLVYRPGDGISGTHSLTIARD